MSGYAETTNNPPPPGTNDESDKIQPQWPPSNRKTLPTAFDPFIKNPEYERYQRRDSRSPDHKRSRHHRDKSDRRRCTRSRSSSFERERYRSRRKREHKSDRSRRSTSHDDDYRRRHRSRDSKRHTNKHASESREGDHRHNFEQQYQHYYPRVSKDLEEVEQQEDTGVEDEEEADPPKDNLFKNDGSFMETFKRMQEEQQRKQQEEMVQTQQEQENPLRLGASTSGSTTVPPRGFSGLGKRRGGRILKTGIVAKPKVEEESTDGEVQDAWSIYLKEVKRYKEACCDDDSKTRPLVK